LWLLGLVCLQGGCNLLPQRLDRPQLHNPFPQLRKVAVVPFFNQSGFPRINGAEVANSYRHQLQQIRGFEVIPVGVVDQYLSRNPIPVNQMPDFQQLARDLGVDAVVVGSITDYDPYYPPKMGLAVRWYAANPGFHPIPPGYGLPWGTAEEEYIPSDLRFEAEFALATEQMKTQTPVPAAAAGAVPAGPWAAGGPLRTPLEPPHTAAPNPMVANDGAGWNSSPADLAQSESLGPPPGLPPDWPDPNGFVPDRPQAQRPISQPQPGPIMELIKQYDGSDSDFTAQLESYFAFRDDARFGGWQSYLERTDDFIKFCCYLHIAELLTARGGAGYTQPVWRWQLSNYQP
jgi:hypothetical protein